MQTVGTGIGDKCVLRARIGIDAGIGIDVHDPRSPDVAGLLDGRHIVVDKKPALVRVRFVGLDVPVAELRVPAMDRREKHDARSGEDVTKMPHRDIDASAERPVVEDELALLEHDFLSVFVHLAFGDSIPFPERNIAVEVVGAGEDEDHIGRLGMLGAILVGLSGNVQHVLPSDSVDERIEPVTLAEKTPVVLRAADVALVGDGIAEEENLLRRTRKPLEP